jgi:programmed cell death protein 4
MKSPARSPAAPGKRSHGRSYDRHSASGRSGAPKKGGAGGKGVWGTALDGGVLDAAYAVDKNDPNYDSDEEGGAFAPPEMSLAAGPKK